MLKFLKQRPNSYHCAPIAILNALKWKGYQVSFKKDFQRIKKSLNYINGKGVYLQDFDNYLNIFNLKNETKFPMNIRTLNKWIKEGCSIVLNFKHPKVDKWHYILCIGKENNKYKVVNYNKNKTIFLIKKNEMRNLLRRKNKNFTSKGWKIIKC